MSLRSSLSFACVLSLAALTVQAAEPAQTLRDACAPDVKQFCATVEAGEGRILRCLRDNQDKLSPACKTAWTAARQVERKSREK